ncbi:hypothetical protein HMPREF9374_3461 [Desmospora sp. 8437]|nr:hypothetical protein HMPREF9374_3461 [Desmospora sp. 8437]
MSHTCSTRPCLSIRGGMDRPFFLPSSADFSLFRKIRVDFPHPLSNSPPSEKRIRGSSISTIS